MPQSGLLRMITSLRFPDFRRLWLSFAASGSGNWTFTLGTGWLIHSLSHSPFWVGVGMFAQLGPALLVAPLAGVWADRFDRRRLTALALASAAVASGVLTALSVLRVNAVAPVVMLSLVYGAAGALLNTVGNALLPNLVPREALLNAVALQGVASRGSEFLGPLVASPLLVAYGPGAVFALCAGFNLLAALLALRITASSASAAGAGRPPARLFAPVVEGLRYVRNRPLLGTLVALVGLHCGLTMSYMGLLPALVGGSMNGGGGMYGDVMMLVGLGAMAGTLLLAPIEGRRLRGWLYLVSAVLSGASLVALAFSPGMMLAMVSSFVVGLSQAIFMTLSMALVQDLVDDGFRGRVSSLYFFLAMGLMALCNWLYGALGEVIAPRLVLGSVGLGFVAAVAGYALASGSLRRIVQGRTEAGALEALPQAL